MTLIRRAAVDQQEWLSAEEFNRHWALCQMTPGINLLALAILLGRHIAGMRGIVICVFGLLFPSAVATALLTSAYLTIRQLPGTQAVLLGLLPASVGLGLITSVQMGRGPAIFAWKAGAFQMLFTMFLVIGSGYLLATGTLSVTLVLLLAGVIGGLEGYVRSRFKGPEESK